MKTGVATASRCYNCARVALLFIFVLALSFAENSSAQHAGVAAAARCQVEEGGWFSRDAITCSYQSTRIASGATSQREVKWQVPVGEPPAEGWPVVLLYQGSFFEVEFSRKKATPFGGYWEVQTIKALLDAKFAVVAPRAAADIAWLTNTPGIDYEKSSDYLFLSNVFSAIEQGEFGPLNPKRQYAAGISSGAYNASRMALSWPGTFKALALQSGSYATCFGMFCSLPERLPAQHPPTLFIHGFFDPAVPWWTMDNYYDQLREEGVAVERVTKIFRGHAWFSESPQLIVEWFTQHQ